MINRIIRTTSDKGINQIAFIKIWEIIITEILNSKAVKLESKNFRNMLI